MSSTWNCSIFTRRTHRHFPVIDFFPEAAENFSVYWTLAHRGRKRSPDDSVLYKFPLFTIPMHVNREQKFVDWHNAGS